jgi:hypothetical protein
MVKKRSGSSKQSRNTVEIRVPQSVIDEADKLDAATVQSIVAAILGDHALFGITGVDIRAHGSDAADPPDHEIRTKC